MRRFLAGIQEVIGRFVTGLAQQEKTAAAQARAVRFGDGKGRTDGDCCVKCVTAGGQGFQPGHGGCRMGAGDSHLSGSAASLGEQAETQNAAGDKGWQSFHGVTLAGES